MKLIRLVAALALVIPISVRAADDTSPHKSQLVHVQQDVDLEVLDWGGNGPALVFLAGLGETAHEFDAFAIKFIGSHHVYGITRRGFGTSSHPAPTDENYDSDRLGDDVLAVLDALKLTKPILAGHSVAGEELSSIGTRHSERISGLIYIEAAYAYSFHFPQIGSPVSGTGAAVEVAVARRDLQTLIGATPSQLRTIATEVPDAVQRLQTYLQWQLKQTQNQPDPAPREITPQQKIAVAVRSNLRKYPAIKQVPIPAIMAVPHACTKNCDDPLYKAQENEGVAQADAIKAAMPNARVVKMAGGDHYVFRSNEADVLREMNRFLDSLAKERN